MSTGPLLFNIALGYALHAEPIQRWGLPPVLCWPILQRMPPHHVWQLHQGVYRVIHDIAFYEDEYIALNHALIWYTQAIANTENHGNHIHTVLKDPHRKGVR